MSLQGVKDFIEQNIDLIDQNEYPILYSKFRSLAPTQEWGLLTEFLLSADIDPLKYMNHVPRFYAFNSKTIYEITMYPHIEYINERSFEKCSKLKRVNMLQKTHVTRIENYAFMQCNNLETIIFPMCLETLGDSVFEKCVQLGSALCNSEVGKIPYRAFYLCSNLKRVELPYALVEIGQDAFRYCTSLESIEIPVHVTKLGNRCFADSGLKQIIFKGTKHQWELIHKYSTWCQGVPQRILVKCTDGTLLESFYD